MVQLVGAGQSAPVGRQAQDPSLLAFRHAVAGAKGPGGQSRAGATGAAAAPPRPDAGGVSAARQQQIKDWVAHHSDSSGGFLGGFLGIGQTSAAQHVHDALTGQAKELGHLTPAEQRCLLNQWLDRCGAGKGDGPGGAAQLLQSFAGNRPMVLLVAHSLAAKAAALMQRPAGNGSGNDPHIEARAYAYDALQAISGEPARTPASYA